MANVIFKTSTNKTIDDLFNWNKNTGIINPNPSVPIVPGTIYFTSDEHIVFDTTNNDNQNVRLWMGKNAYSAIYAQDINDTTDISNVLSMIQMHNNLIAITSNRGDLGSTITPRYLPYKWYVSLDHTPSDGEILLIKTPSAVTTAGVYLSIEGNVEDKYHPIAIGGTTRLTTQYSSGDIIFLTYQANKKITCYPLNPVDNNTIAYNNENSPQGIWRILNYYDSNTNTLLRTYALNTNKEYPLVGLSTNTDGSIPATHTSSYKDLYGMIPSSNKATINLSTGKISASGGFQGNLTGNATTASAVAQNATNSNNTNYRILLSGNATNNAETTSLNKSNNLIYNPSTNKLSTGNIDVGGNINITGNANLNGETSIDSATVGNILINGSASFVQSPIAPTPISGDSSTKIATTAFVSNAINQGFAINDAMVFKGVIGSNQIITSLPTQGYNAGWTYRVADAGTYAGEYCEVGDLIIAIKDGPASGSSVINTDWAKIEHNIDGAVFRGAGASNNSVGSGTQPVYVNNSGIVIPTTYSLAKSVPSNAEFTDNKVAQNSSSANGWRKILLNGNANNYNSNDWQGDITTQTSEVYQSKYLSANPSTGSLSAKRYYVRGSANSNNYITSNAADNLYFMVKSTATNTDICTLVLKGKTNSTTETTVKPGQDATVDLGTSSDKWNALYIKNLQVPSSGTITASLPIKVEHIANNGKEFEITYNDTIDFALMVGAGNINHGLYDYKKNSGAWILSADSTHNWILNGSASKWTTARTITKAGDLQGEFSLDGSGNVTDTTYINYIRAIRNNSNSSYCYHRILRTNGKISSEYYDASAILILNQGFVGGNYGIARVVLRTNRITTNPTAPSVEITWLVRKGFSIDALQFGLINDNGKAIADIYLKETTPYGGTFIRVLQDFRSTPENRWIKVNSSAMGSGPNGTNTTNTEVYTSISSPYTETENGVTTTIPYTSTSTSDAINATKDAGIVQTISSTLTVNKGGTGQTSLAENKILIGNGTNAIKTTSLEVDNEGNLSNTKTNQTDLSYNITNNRGSIGLRVAENRGLFDYTQNKWIIYKPSTSTGTDNVGQTLIPSWANKGSTSIPVYFNNMGEPVGITSFTTNYVLVGNGTNGIKASSKLQIPVNDTGTITALLPVSISGKLQILNENNSNYSVGSGHLIIGGKANCNYNATLEMQMGASNGKSWQFSVENYQGSDGSFVIRNNYLGESPGYNNLYNNTTNNSSKTVLDINFATYNTTLKGALSINNGLTIAGYIPYILFSDTQNSPSSKWKIKASGTLLKFLSGDNDKERINFVTGDNSFAINPADISNNNTLGNSDNRWSSTYLRENIYIGQNNNEVVLQYDSTNKTLNFIFN